MRRREKVAWGLVALAVVAAAGLGWRAHDASDRELRLEAERDSAEAAAQAANRDARAAWAARDSAEAARVRQDSIADAEIEAAERRAQREREAAWAEAEQFRADLTADQQRRFDAIEARWQRVDEENRAVVDSLRSKLVRAEADAEDNLATAITERRRADRWEAAYQKAEAQIDELQRPDFEIFGFGLKVGCKVGGSATFDVIPRDDANPFDRVAVGPGVTCGIG